MKNMYKHARVVDNFLRFGHAYASAIVLVAPGFQKICNFLRLCSFYCGQMGSFAIILLLHPSFFQIEAHRQEEQRLMQEPVDLRAHMR